MKQVPEQIKAFISQLSNNEAKKFIAWVNEHRIKTIEVEEITINLIPKWCK
jgi:predicted flavoprotein YhiN